MDAKKPSDKKVFDITSPKKVSPSATTRPLIVNRPVMKQDPMVNNSVMKSEEQASTAPPLSPPKRVTIAPLHEDDKEDAKPATEAKKSGTSKPADEPVIIEDVPEEMPDAPKEDSEPKPEPANHTNELNEVSTIDDAAIEERDSSGDAQQPEPDIEALKAAEAEAARQQELEGIIESREYFVPINAVERKRSLKITIGLMILVVILGVALIDLMIDAGIIGLIQNLPHTHFFEVHK